MIDYDVFNGDADGICALIQLRLAEPREAQLITGVKRDIKLVGQLDPTEADRVCVLDLSMEKNTSAVKALLESGSRVFYVDHHRPGLMPESESLEAHIDMAPTVCTALIVNDLLEGRYLSWALTAAFGDNLGHVAEPMAREAGFNDVAIEQMKALGTYVNYNGYGASLEDLYFHPKDLYSLMKDYETPFEFMANRPDIFELLEAGYREDMEKAGELEALRTDSNVALFILPDEKWARRVSGVFSNSLANKNPNRAHAILTEKPSGGYLVSLRAPKNRPEGADVIATTFPTGGGRKAAAGINQLAESDVGKLYDALLNYYRV